MSDKVENSSLADLASHKGKVSRDAPDRRARSFSSRATGKAGFDGFLNTFLGKPGSGAQTSAGRGSGDSLAGRLNANKTKTAKSAEKTPAGKMNADDRKSLRRSLDKTVPADGDELQPETLAAAEEAALLIWNLLYGTGADGDFPAPDGDGLGRLAEALRAHAANGAAGGTEALSGMGTSGLDLRALQNAVETANASAEMNAAAVLSALDGLLDGMPREALAEAIAKTAEAAGADLEVGVLNRIAAALDAEVVSSDAGAGPDLLALLAGGGGAGALVAAESAGETAQMSDILALFQTFLRENPTRGAVAGADGAADGFDESSLQSFAHWLQERGNLGDGKELFGDVSKLAEALLRAAAGVKTGAVQAGGEFSRILGDLEKFLQTRTGGERSSDFPDGAAGGSSGAAGGTGQAPSGAAAAQPVQAAPQAMSGMLNQIDNIERLAEAMRMANRGPVKNITMQLSPPELGKVMLRVEARGGVVSAILRVEKPEAAAELANNLARLRENLKAQGIELGELDIQQRGQDEALGDFGGRRGRDGAEAEYADIRFPGRVRGAPDAESESPPEAAPRAAGPGVLNLFA